MAPILCRVEGGEGHRLPRFWNPRAQPVWERQREWLCDQLPTYSQDSLEEVIHLAQAQGCRAKGRLGPKPGVSLQPEALEPPSGYRLMDAFQRLCERYFRWTGNELSVREGLMEEVHELALRFPVRHLIRHSHARAVSAGFLDRWQALKMPEHLGRLQGGSTGLRAVVGRGLSEGHLHLGGVMSAEETWADYLLGTAMQGVLRGMQPDEGRLLALSRAGVRLMALGLLYADRAKAIPLAAFMGLLSCLDSIYYARSRPQERKWCNDLSQGLRQQLGQALTEAPPASADQTDWLLRLASATSHRLWLQRNPFRRHLQKNTPSRFRQRILDLERLHFEVQRVLLDLEADLTAEAARRTDTATCRASGPRQDLYAFLHSLYYRYLVYNTHHWHLSTQSGRTTGLREFQRFYESKHRTPWAARSLGEDEGLIVERLRGNLQTEVRLSPQADVSKLEPWILGFARDTNENGLQKFGFVLHFIKEEHNQEDSNLDRKHDARDKFPSLRFGRIRQRTRKKALQLHRLLSTPHPVVPFIVGIDAASLELTTPPEVFAPAFRFLREYPISVRHRSTGWELGCRYHDIVALVEDRRLGMTYHVGEDFRHLLSGLRSIHEAVEFLQPRPGDRLGHAIALGLDPEVWASQLGFQSVLPKQEWLDTLVWLHHFLGPSFKWAGRLSIADEIQRLSQQIYGHQQPVWSPQILYEAWLARQLDPECFDLDELRQGKCRLVKVASRALQNARWREIQAMISKELHSRAASREAYKLLAGYWYCPSIRQKGKEIMAVDMMSDRQAWLDTCHEAQEGMRRLICSKEIVIEVNPMSNRVIGPMSRLSDHHIFQLTLDKNLHPIRDFPVTVNTDDPGVFNTSLSHEYFLLGESLLRRGVAEPQVAEWLEWLRRNGVDFSFLSTLPEADSRHAQALIESLKKANPSIVRHLEGSVRPLPRL